ncbi:MAG: hypothetical protein QOE87_3969 [Gaiellales bacterium]|nr:hypothetical protein [Gaiellales bacterium]
MTLAASANWTLTRTRHRLAQTRTAAPANLPAWPISRVFTKPAASRSSRRFARFASIGRVAQHSNDRSPTASRSGSVSRTTPSNSYARTRAATSSSHSSAPGARTAVSRARARARSTPISTPFAPPAHGSPACVRARTPGHDCGKKQKRASPAANTSSPPSPGCGSGTCSATPLPRASARCAAGSLRDDGYGSPRSFRHTEAPQLLGSSLSDESERRPRTSSSERIAASSGIGVFVG